MKIRRIFHAFQIDCGVICITCRIKKVGPLVNYLWFNKGKCLT